MRHASGRDPRDLVELIPGAAAPPSPVLLVALEGFVDAGSGVRLLRDALLESGSPRLLVEFDADALVDYRYRRPVLTFERNRWTALALPRIEVVAVTDAADHELLLLNGPEPDIQWQRFAAAVELVVRALGVRLVVGMDAVPLAVPHTRPLGLSIHSTEARLREGHVPWFDQALVPGSASHVVEFLLGEHGIPTLGFAVHVPQYLSQSDYPAAALRLAEAVSAATGLSLALPVLEAAAVEVGERVAAEAAASSEVQEMVATLEKQYDRYLLARSSDGELPGAEELGAELERFLAEQTRRDDS